MKTKVMVGLVCIACLALGRFAALGDEASGLVSEPGFGSFQLDEKGTARLFSLSSRSTAYEPADWRPAKGDEVTVTYTTQTKRGKTLLVVDKLKLVKAGPNTITISSPVTVEITEVGRTGVNAKIPTGQVIKFTYDRKTQKLPAGWVPAVGEKANIEFRTDVGLGGFRIPRVIIKMEKVTQP